MKKKDEAYMYGVFLNEDYRYEAYSYEKDNLCISIINGKINDSYYDYEIFIGGGLWNPNSCK
ncbi:MAG TPA: hypothetical protein GX497_00460 [Bacillus bacterium]|nr:hypothetical protein [Bacillus sp. (in: firmicutes)]